MTRKHRPITHNTCDAVRAMVARMNIRKPRRAHANQVHADADDAIYGCITVATSRKDKFRIQVLAANAGKPVGRFLREVLREALNLDNLPYEIEHEAEQQRDRARARDRGPRA